FEVSVTLKSHVGRHSGVATHLPASASGTGSVGATSSLSHAAAANVASNNTASARSLGFRGFIFLLRIRYEVQGSRNLGGAPPPGQAGRPGSARVSGAHPPDQQLRTGQPAAARAPGRRGRRRPRASPRLGT